MRAQSVSYIVNPYQLIGLNIYSLKIRIHEKLIVKKILPSNFLKDFIEILEWLSSEFGTCDRLDNFIHARIVATPKHIHICWMYVQFSNIFDKFAKMNVEYILMLWQSKFVFNLIFYHGHDFLVNSFSQ